jgi:hypothetical protein
MNFPDDLNQATDNGPAEKKRKLEHFLSDQLSFPNVELTPDQYSKLVSILTGLDNRIVAIEKQTEILLENITAIKQQGDLMRLVEK